MPHVGERGSRASSKTRLLTDGVGGEGSSSNISEKFFDARAPILK